MLFSTLVRFLALMIPYLPERTFRKHETAFGRILPKC